MKKDIRLIARLDLKGKNLIKGIQLEGLRKVGVPEDHAEKYYVNGIDEIICLDVVASLYGRSNLFEVVSHTTDKTFVPVTAGGGVRNLSDVQALLDAGADKVAINTAALADAELLSEISDKYGSQCLVLSIECKRDPSLGYLLYAESGREKVDITLNEYLDQAQKRGVGEILVTSVDREGTRKGFDCELVGRVCDLVDVPVIASGGFGALNHLDEVLEAGADAVAIADGFHLQNFQIQEIKTYIGKLGYSVREVIV